MAATVRRPGADAAPAGVQVDDVELEPTGKLVDPGEALRFIDWMPRPAAPSHAYYAAILVRARHLRARGAKVRDTVLEAAVVPGYAGQPGRALLLRLRRLALLASHPGLYVDTVRVGGAAEVRPVPAEAAYVFVSPNLHDWVEASIRAVKEFTESLWRAATGATERPTRLDVRVRSALPATRARGVTWRFALDVDDPGLLGEVVERVAGIVGFRPAVVRTPRGGHVLLGWDEVPAGARKELAGLLRGLDEYGGRVEYHRVPFEPLPGSIYRNGFVVRFEPPEK